jgi:hypothetical protein
MLEIEQVVTWLRQDGNGEAASLLSKADQQYIWIDSACELHGHRDWDIYELRILLPPAELKRLPDMKPTVEAIEQAYRDLAPSTGCAIYEFTWMPRVPDLDKAGSIVELEALDVPHVRDLWSKAVTRVASDPDGAVTAARSLLESTCKYILFECNNAVTDNPKLPTLLHRTLSVLELSPRQNADRDLKKVLGNAQAVVDGVAALRGLLGDAHGRSPQDGEATPEQAELAVNLAGSVALFLVRSFEVADGHGA